VGLLSDLACDLGIPHSWRDCDEFHICNVAHYYGVPCYTEGDCGLLGDDTSRMYEMACGSTLYSSNFVCCDPSDPSCIVSPAPVLTPAPVPEPIVCPEPVPYGMACDSEPCQNGGTCTILPGSSAYLCTCTAGWEGYSCSADIDECATDPCPGDEQCVDGLGDYTCVDADECASAPCKNGGVCDDSLSDPSVARGAYRCTCTSQSAVTWRLHVCRCGRVCQCTMQKRRRL
jgi:hypothetical protein